MPHRPSAAERPSGDGIAVRAPGLCLPGAPAPFRRSAAAGDLVRDRAALLGTPAGAGGRFRLDHRRRNDNAADAPTTSGGRGAGRAEATDLPPDPACGGTAVPARW